MPGVSAERSPPRRIIPTMIFSRTQRKVKNCWRLVGRQSLAAALTGEATEAPPLRADFYRKERSRAYYLSFCALANLPFSPAGFFYAAALPFRMAWIFIAVDGNLHQPPLQIKYLLLDGHRQDAHLFLLQLAFQPEARLGQGRMQVMAAKTVVFRVQKDSPGQKVLIELGVKLLQAVTPPGLSTRAISFKLPRQSGT